MRVDGEGYGERGDSERMGERQISASAAASMSNMIGLASIFVVAQLR